jgi:hypothetical protein
MLEWIVDLSSFMSNRGVDFNMRMEDSEVFAGI